MNRIKIPPSKRRDRLRPPEPFEALRKITRMFAASMRQAGEPADRIEQLAREGFDEALSGGARKQTLDHLGVPTEFVNTAGLFAIAFDNFGLDRSNAEQVEQWREVMLEALAAA